jgi:hypothetical protein
VIRRIVAMAMTALEREMANAKAAAAFQVIHSRLL